MHAPIEAAQIFSAHEGKMCSRKHDLIHIFGQIEPLRLANKAAARLLAKAFPHLAEANGSWSTH